VVQQDDAGRSGRRRQPDRVFRGRVPEGSGRVEILGVPERVVQQDIRAASSRVTSRIPVPASSSSSGAVTSSGAMARQDVCPPNLTNSRPGAGVDPRLPQMVIRT
jgi:hypothetical protein